MSKTNEYNVLHWFTYVTSYAFCTSPSAYELHDYTVYIIHLHVWYLPFVLGLTGVMQGRTLDILVVFLTRRAKNENKAARLIEVLVHV